MGQIYTKNTNLGDFGGIFKAKRVKFGARVRTCDSLPMQNFVKNQLKRVSPWGKKKFSPKIRNFRDFPHNVEILLNRTDLGIPQQHEISSESLKGPAGIALPRGGDF